MTAVTFDDLETAAAQTQPNLKADWLNILGKQGYSEITGDDPVITSLTAQPYTRQSVLFNRKKGRAVFIDTESGRPEVNCGLKNDAAAPAPAN